MTIKPDIRCYSPLGEETTRASRGGQRIHRETDTVKQRAPNEMKTITPLRASALCLTACLSACAEQDSYAQLEDPYTLDGVEIEQIIEDDPSIMFELDMVNIATYRIDQRVAEIDFERVLVRIPGLEPVTMSEFAGDAGIDITRHSWTLSRVEGLRAEWFSGCEIPASFWYNGVKFCYCEDIQIATE